MDKALLYGDSRSNLLNCEPLDHYEEELLNELVEKLYAHYLENLNSPIGGNWGLLSLSFQHRDGIILYN